MGFVIALAVGAAGLVAYAMWRNHQWSRSMAIYIAMLLGLASFIFAVISDRNNTERKLAQSDIDLCLKIVQPVSTLLNRSQKTIASNPYYKEHPDQLEDAKKNNAELLKAYDPKSCYDLPSNRNVHIKQPTQAPKISHKRGV